MSDGSRLATFETAHIRPKGGKHWVASIGWQALGGMHWVASVGAPVGVVRCRGPSLAAIGNLLRDGTLGFCDCAGIFQDMGTHRR